MKLIYLWLLLFYLFTQVHSKSGDGKVDEDGSEECEDGNTSPGDGCSSKCGVETGYECKGGNSSTKGVCSFITGDELIVGIEECDDGN
jgi:cysteine-rich repeat protein